MFRKFLFKLLVEFLAFVYFMPQIFYFRFKILILRFQNRRLRLQKTKMLTNYGCGAMFDDKSFKRFD